MPQFQPRLIAALILVVLLALWSCNSSEEYDSTLREFRQKVEQFSINPDHFRTEGAGRLVASLALTSDTMMDATLIRLWVEYCYLHNPPARLLHLFHEDFQYKIKRIERGADSLPLSVEIVGTYAHTYGELGKFRAKEEYAKLDVYMDSLDDIKAMNALAVQDGFEISDALDPATYRKYLWLEKHASYVTTYDYGLELCTHTYEVEDSIPNTLIFVQQYRLTALNQIGNK